MKNISIFLISISLLFIVVSLHAQTDEAMKLAADKIKGQIAEKGLSLAERKVLTATELSLGILPTLYPGNYYVIVLSTDGIRSSTLSMKASPFTLGEKEEIKDIQEQYNIGEMPKKHSIEEQGNHVLLEIDMQNVPIPIDYWIDLAIDKADIQSDTKLNVLTFYMSMEHYNGNITENRDEKFYEKSWKDYYMKEEAQETAIDDSTSDSESTMTSNSIKDTSGYESMSIEKIKEENESLSTQSPSGLDADRASTGINIWQQILVVEAKGESILAKTFKIMDNEWQSEYSKYRSNSSSEKLIHELKGELSHMGFTKEGLYVVDHIINNTLMARYYFKYPKDRKGGIIPQYEIKEGKMHITPWHKVVVIEE